MTFKSDGYENREREGLNERQVSSPHPLSQPMRDDNLSDGISAKRAESRLASTDLKTDPKRPISRFL